MIAPGGRPTRAAVAAAFVALALAACGGDDESPADAAYVDDRGPGAQTAPNEKLPGGQYEDSPVEGNQAVQAEESLRDFQESLATGSGSGACREVSDALERRLAAGGSCVEAVEDAAARRRAEGSPYRPSKVLAVDLRGLKRAVATIQDGDSEPIQVELLLELPEQHWAVQDADLGEPSGFSAR